MSIYLEDYSGTLQPARTPFEFDEESAGPCCFIYMTNRYEGRWSYLLPIGFERQHDPFERIRMGYTQLWIMQPLRVVHPKLVASIETATKALANYRTSQTPMFAASDVVRADYEEVLHVLREPLPLPASHNDYLGPRRREDQALQLAECCANELGCRTLVAKLLHDWAWH